MLCTPSGTSNFAGEVHRSLMVAACSHKGEYLPDTPDDDNPDNDS